MKQGLLLLFVCCLSIVQAQDYSVAYFKGTVEISSAGGWAALKTIGTRLGKQQDVRLRDKAELVCYGPKGETVYIKKAGTYNVSAFSKYIVSDDQSSISAYYLSSVAHQLTHKESNPEKDYDKQMKNLGGVARGKYGCMNHPLHASLIIDSTITLAWNNLHRTNYTVHIFEDAEYTQIKADLDAMDTVMLINRYKLNLEPGRTYYWTIIGENLRTCEIASFVILSTEEEAKVKAEVLKFNDAEISNSLKEAALGKFYEDKGLYENARKSYLKASTLEPENESFRQLLSEFDVSMGLK